MAKLNAVEAELDIAKRVLADLFDGDIPDSIATLFESSEMGMRGFRVISGMRPLVVALWENMSSNGDPNRFAVENMIKEMDAVIGYWVIPDAPDEKEESVEPEK
jgi:hypothetical protein